VTDDEHTYQVPPDRRQKAVRLSQDVMHTELYRLKKIELNF